MLCNIFLLPLLLFPLVADSIQPIDHPEPLLQFRCPGVVPSSSGFVAADNLYISGFMIMELDEQEKRKFPAAGNHTYMMTVLCTARESSSLSAHVKAIINKGNVDISNMTVVSKLIHWEGFVPGIDSYQLAHELDACPESNPYPYYSGKYCCESVRDTRPECDKEGKEFQEGESRCCAENKFVKCPGVFPCQKLPNSYCLKDVITEDELRAGDVWTINFFAPDRCDRFNELSIYTNAQLKPGVEDEGIVAVYKNMSQVSVAAFAAAISVLSMLMLGVLVAVMLLAWKILRGNDKREQNLIGSSVE